MSAYAALLSLHQIMGLPLFQRSIVDERAQDLLHRVVGDVIRFLDKNSATQIPELEKDITEAAYKSVDFIHIHILNSGPIFSFLFNNYKLFFWIFWPVAGIQFLLICYHTIRQTEYSEYPMLLHCLTCSEIALLIFYTCLFKAVTDSQDLCVNRVRHYFDDIMIRIGDHCDPARAALNTLLSKVDLVLASRSRFRISQSEIAHLESLHEMASSLLGFIGNAPLNNTELQAITDAAHEARNALIHYPYGNLTLQRLLVLFYAWWVAAVNAYFPYLFEWVIGVFNPPQEILVCCIFIVQSWIDLYWFVSVAGCVVVTRIKYLLGKRYSEESKYHAVLSQVVDDFRMVVRDVTENKDAFRSQSELPAASSKPDLGGRGRAHVVVGLDNDMTAIKSRMVQNWSKRGIVSIVGMGGIGKTTLATQVYNDPAILSHFDIRAWVQLSQVYSKRHVLLSLLESLLNQTDPDSAKELRRTMPKHKLCMDLRKILWRRRYLIVMDDMWDTKIWDFMSPYFPENHNGSCVLLTSRSSNVVSYPDPSSPLHQMKGLNEDDSWYLLHEIVFGAEGYPLELESIGREIARGCKGLPLAISVVGGLIYKDNRIEIWRDVADKIKHSQSSEIKEQCLEILGLSYDHLPHCLRPFFLYMGNFPGDCEIPIYRLINLWIAEGFLDQYHQKTKEEWGEFYLKNLIDRNLISVGKRSCIGNIKTCSIHDLLRDVCVKNAQEENFLQVVELEGHGNSGWPHETTRRLSINPNALRDDARDLMSSYHTLHSLLFIDSKPITDRRIGVYLDFMYLLVLDVLAVHFDEFPHQIIKFRFLRYLAFHCDGPFPASISKLENLETIVHHHCLFGKYPLYTMVVWSHLRHLYVNPNLRHLFVKPGYDLSQFLWGLNSLIHLRTLVGAINMRWSQSMVRRILNLKKLVISYDVSSSDDWSHYQLECLVELRQLESLKITMVPAVSNDPRKFAFPVKLKKLSLSGCGIPWERMAGMGALPNLEALKLRHEAFCGPSWETMEKQFPQLTFLLLEEMCFASWETKAAHFPRLQRLVLKSCGALEEFPYCFGDIPTLKMIQLIKCHPSAVDSATEMLQEQEENGNEELKLHVLDWGSGNGQQQEDVDDFDAEEDSEETADETIGND